MAKKKVNHKNKKATVAHSKRELLYKEDGQEYAQVLSMLGNRRVQCLCFDGKERQCTIRGKMCSRRKVWIAVGDIVLVTLRDFQDDKCDVVHKFNSDEIRKLRKKGEIPDVDINANSDLELEEDDCVVFGNSGSEDENDDDDGLVLKKNKAVVVDSCSDTDEYSDFDLENI